MKLEAEIFLHGELIAKLSSDGNTSEVVLENNYLENQNRHTLSVSIFSMQPERLRLFSYQDAPLPPFIKSILPEGAMREYFIDMLDKYIDGESFTADAHILRMIGSNLSGALEVRNIKLQGFKDDFQKDIPIPDENQKSYFSLPGVQRKFSLNRINGKFRFPSTNESGEYIVKPQLKNGFLHIALNEYFHMKLACLCGLDVPEIGLISSDDMDIGDHESSILEGETHFISYFVKRFDRDNGQKIHMEELHQVIRFYGQVKLDSKYRDASYAELLKVLYSLEKHFKKPIAKQYLKELCFNMIIGNADFHLKNSALIYHDKITPSKAPSYDILNTSIIPNENHKYFDDMALEVYEGCEIQSIKAFDEVVYLELLEASECPFDECKGLYHEVKNLVLKHYQEAFSDPVLRRYSNPVFDGAIQAYLKEVLQEG